MANLRPRALVVIGIGCSVLALLATPPHSKPPTADNSANSPTAPTRVTPPASPAPPPPVASPPVTRFLPTPVPPQSADSAAATRGFAPVRLTDLQRPLPNNEVWIVKTVLLNPAAGSLQNPGEWAAPAQVMRGHTEWK